MAIKKRPPKIDTVEEFIAGAPDGKGPARFRRGNKVQITLTLDENLLDQADLMAKGMGVSRSALISVALAKVFNSGDL